ncbi:DUF262 domain-containing protein [uncultured Thiodictyon sp.]|uniref:GmrSD restriction endonuclease domain-containing protein n=1 Tax=uncultured Thiodictyon sp. TaxID=1846217 RepID=UPI0025FF9E35|nr:DUF262 domain-containing protein [uncultured Thiodictyon sp.]
MTTFDTTKEFLSGMLEQLGDGKTQLPDFQRSWVWDDDHIRSVLASVARSFPIGAVMMLRTGGDVRFQPRPVQGVTFPPQGRPEPERLVLDGQQRLTSLYQALMLDKVVETVNAKKQKIKRWYYIDMRKAVQSPEDMEEAIVGLPESRQLLNFRGELIADYSTLQREYEAELFPIRNVFDDDNWRMAYSEFWDFDRDRQKFYNEFGKRVLNAFNQYQVPLIVLDRTTSKEAVCQVFEKVNTGGVSLTAFELLTATYAADNFNLRDDWFGNQERQVAGREPRLHQKKVLQRLANTDFLQVVALLYTSARRDADMTTGLQPEEAAAVSCKRVTILNLPLDGYRQWADGAVEGLERAARFLFQQNIFSPWDLPYQTQVVPLAAILIKLGNRWEDDGIRRKVALWFWCGVFGELYGGGIESRAARDLPEVLAWIDGGAEPQTVIDANFSRTRLLTLRTRNSAAYKGLHALLMRDGAQDFRTGVPIDEASFWDERIDIHHIFPQVWCVRQGIPSQRYNSIVNKAAVSARTNRIVGGQSPSAYLQRIQEQAGIGRQRMDEILGTHVIDQQWLRADHFEGFFAAREDALVTRIAAAMGKAVLQQASEQEPVTESNGDDSADDAADGES